MGGSLAKALVRNGACKEVRALVRHERTAEDAVTHGAAHLSGTDPNELLQQADLVVLATPVRTITEQVTSLNRFIKPGAVMTDMGSVKTGIVEAMDGLPDHIRAIGGHPMCGKEKSGLAAADPDLFQAKVWALTPTGKTDQQALRIVEALIESVGARKIVLDARSHDIAVSCVSHLPYLLAATLVGVAEDAARDRPEIWQLAASGFRDVSRVACSDLTMMIDILAANRDNAIRMLNQASQRIDGMIQLLSENNEDDLQTVLSKVRERRASMFQN
jgi:prephenate dehydrogenase